MFAGEDAKKLKSDYLGLFMMALKEPVEVSQAAERFSDKAIEILREDREEILYPLHPLLTLARLKAKFHKFKEAKEDLRSIRRLDLELLEKPGAESPRLVPSIHFTGGSVVAKLSPAIARMLGTQSRNWPRSIRTNSREGVTQSENFCIILFRVRLLRSLKSATLISRGTFTRWSSPISSPMYPTSWRSPKLKRTWETSRPQERLGEKYSETMPILHRDESPAFKVASGRCESAQDARDFPG